METSETTVPPHKKMLVLGATGKTGRELIDISLERGHELTAFVRSPAKITRQDRRLTVVKGDPRCVEELCKILFQRGERVMPTQTWRHSMFRSTPRRWQTRDPKLDLKFYPWQAPLFALGVYRARSKSCESASR